jgi:hypothetical protein
MRGFLVDAREEGRALIAAIITFALAMDSIKLAVFSRLRID